MEVLSKHAGLWITRNREIMYSQVGVEIFSSYTCRTHSNTNYTAENVLQATHINFICPMRYDSFPLDTQVAKGLKIASMGLCLTVQLYTVCIKKTSISSFKERQTPTSTEAVVN